LYENLDKSWSETTIHEFAEWYISKNSFEKIKLNQYMPTLHLNLFNLTIYQFATKAKWEGYKTAVLLCAENYSSKILNNGKEK